MRGRVIGVLLGGAVLCAADALSQSRFQNVGPNECVNCHDHQNQRQWYEKGEIQDVQKRFPQKSANAGHINSLKQLEAPKSNDFAKALGVRDKYDLAGACVRCHATVFAGDANAGVSCESCHGPASGYLKPHQTKGAYAQSVTLGMNDVVGKVAAWAEQCTRCHVVDDQRLVAAGHPSGDTFDLGAMFAPVSVHFVKKYNDGDVRAQSQELVRRIIASRAAPPPASNAGAAAGQRPPVNEPPPQAPAASSAVSMAPPPAAAQPVKGPAPVVPPVSAVAPAAPARGVTPPAASAPAPPAQTVPSSAPAVAASPASLVAAEAPPSSVSGALALAQGKLIAELTSILASGATVPVRSSISVPQTPYAGPDADLLEIQREAIALALEILGTLPAPPPQPQPAR